MRSAILDVLNGVAPERRPMWFMRQAGRYLPEYREVRSKAGSFLDLCYNPELACEVTLQPLRRFDLDAAILFADILVVPHAMGLGVRFAEGEGPILEKIGDMAGVGRLKDLVGSVEVARVCETVSLVRQSLDTGRALIGFCGGPWTVASYMVEGGTSDRANAKVAALQGAEWFRALIERLVVQSVEYLSAQVAAGAQVLQIFDSWAGELPGLAGEEFVERPLLRMVEMLRARHPDVPVIVFARGYGIRLSRFTAEKGVRALGIEAELPMDWAAGNLGPKLVLQGNLDPVALLAGKEVAIREAEAVARSIPMSRHIFNLGHGIRVGTEASVVGDVVAAVRRFDRDEA